MFGQDGVQRVAFDVAPDHADAAVAVAVRPDGGVLLVGRVATESQGSALGVVGLGKHGRLDPGFASGGALLWRDPEGYYLVPGAAALQEDGMLVVTGTRYPMIPVAAQRQPQALLTGDWFVLRVLANGSGLDPGFGTGGWLKVNAGGMLNIGEAVALQPDGKLVVAGTIDELFGPRRMHVTRLHPNGSVDTGFATDGHFREAFATGYASASARTVLVTQEGKILIGGTARKSGGDADMAVIRLGADGVPDPGFGALPEPGRVVVDFSTALVPSDDEVGVMAYRRMFLVAAARRIILGGFTRPNPGLQHPALAALDYDGSPSTGFGDEGRLTVAPPWSDSYDNRVVALGLERIDPNTLELADRIVVGGGTRTVIAPSCFARRIDFSGVADPLFNRGFTLLLRSGSSASDTCSSGRLQAGRLVLVGAATPGLVQPATDFLAFGVLAGSNLFRHGFE
jgi:uncharacterized delta-60 repeat protein